MAAHDALIAACVRKLEASTTGLIETYLARWARGVRDPPRCSDRRGDAETLHETTRGANMAGYSRLYVIGGAGGALGADGANPIDFLILVGDADRQWLEPHYFDKSIEPMGRVRIIVPAEPNQADSLLDACIAFSPRRFDECPSLAEVESALQDFERLDFHLSPKRIPAGWAGLREEARSVFARMGVWRADFVPIARTRT